MGKSESGNVSLSSLSAEDQAKINALVDSQYKPEEAEEENAAPPEKGDETVTVPWRERDGGQYPYLVRGAFLRCQYGSHARKLNLPRSHADYIGEDPLMNAEDCVPGEGFNISPFGVCQAPSGPKGVGEVLLKAEKVNPVDGQPYRDVNGDIAKIEDNVKGPPCTPMIVGLWQNTHKETLVGAVDENKAEAITVGSFLVCSYCGIIEPMTSGQTLVDPAADGIV